MKHPRIASLLSVLLLLVTACNQTVTGIGTTDVSATPAVTATPDPYPIAEQAHITTSLEALLQSRMDAGEVTPEQGLVDALKYLAGEADLGTLNPSGEAVTSYAGSGILRQANAYLAAGSDEATKAEIRRLIGLILPDEATLLRFSRPASAATGGGVEASPVRQTADCRSLWADGFPAGSSAICFEYETVEVGGQTYQIFFPTSWPEGDPRRAFFEPTVQAVRDAVQAYEAFGSMPSGTLVFTLLPDPEFPAAYAATDQYSQSGPCQIALLPPGTGLSVEDFQQTVAHELFHCFQSTNYWAQSNVGDSTWWVEGTAEFFSNVVYPTYNAERTFWNDFDINSRDASLFNMDYENEVFFQFLASQGGNEAVLGLIASMPSSAGLAAQQAALAAYPGIDALFHQFAKDYLDRHIVDTSGSLISVSPTVDGRRIFDATRTEYLSVSPFVVARALFVFPDHKRHSLTETLPDGLTSDSKPVDGDVWQALPPQLAPVCDGPLTMIYTVTSTAAAGGAEEVGVRSDVEDLPEAACDRCLVGTWRLDNESLWSAFETIMASGDSMFIPTSHEMSGQVLVIFHDDGKVDTQYQAFQIHYTQDLNIGDQSVHADAQIGIGGDMITDWYTDPIGTLFAGNVIYAQPEYVTHLVMTAGGMQVELPVQIPEVRGIAPGTYQCSDTTLQLLSPVANQYINYTRVSP